jgi:outer membrane receptor protein involved in Fe transport
MNKCLISGAVAAALLGSGVTIANELEEIVVTAQKRAESLADVPISLTVVSGAQIEQQGTTTMEQLAYSIPNLKITQTALANRVAIRGIATGDNKGFEQSVAMFVDGIYYGRDQLIRLPLVDLERVEVLRGPQPTLFGKNAIAGAISLVTRKPTEEFEASVDVMHELEAEETRFTGVLSGPLSENVRARLVANYREMDGYVYNSKMQRNEPNLDESFLRGQLDFGSEGGLRANLKLEYADFKTVGQPREVFGPVGSYSAVFVGPFAVETSLDGRREDNGYESDNEVTNAILTLDYPLGENTLTSVTGLLDYSVKELIDVDFSAISLLDGTNQTEDYQQLSQEIRISSPTTGRFNYIAGVYYQKSELDVTDLVVFNRTFLGFGPPFSAIGDTTNDRLYAQDSTLWSAFAQGEFALSDRVRLTVGARFNDESKDGSRNLTINKGPANLVPVPVVETVFRALNIEAHSIAGDLSESSFNPMANIKFDLSDNTMLYATYARGSKAGGFDVRSNSLPTSTTVARPGAFKFDEETADNIEAGIRYNRSDVSLHISAYHTKYKDLQVNIFDGTLNFNVRNAAEAVTKGIEADGRVAVGEYVVLSAAVAYLDFEFENFPNGQCYFQQTPGAGGFCDYSGERNALTPEWSGTLGFDFARPLGNALKFGFNFNVDFSSSYIALANLDPRTKQDSFEKIGARVSIGSADDRWEVAIIGRNLTDETILQTAGAMPLATTITRGTGVAYNGIFDRPKSIALSARYRF